MKRLTRTTIAITASLGLLIPLAGCGSADDTVQEMVSEDTAGEDLEADVEPNSTSDSDDDDQTSTGDDDQASEIDTVELPADWPSDLPLPKDHLIVQVDDHQDSGRMPGITVSFAAPGEAEDVDEQIRTDMTAAGYEEPEPDPVELDGGGFIIRQTSYESDSHRVSVHVTDMSIPGMPEELVLGITYMLATGDTE